jgi:hypothetical protein
VSTPISSELRDRLLLRLTPGPYLAESTTGARQSIDIPGESSRIDKFGFRLISISDPEYPSPAGSACEPGESSGARAALLTRTC